MGPIIEYYKYHDSIKQSNDDNVKTIAIYLKRKSTESDMFVRLILKLMEEYARYEYLKRGMFGSENSTCKVKCYIDEEKSNLNLLQLFADMQSVQHKMMFARSLDEIEVPVPSEIAVVLYEEAVQLKYSEAFVYIDENILECKTYQRHSLEEKIWDLLFWAYLCGEYVSKITTDLVEAKKLLSKGNVYVWHNEEYESLRGTYLKYVCCFEQSAWYGLRCKNLRRRNSTRRFNDFLESKVAKWFVYPVLVVFTLFLLTTLVPRHGKIVFWSFVSLFFICGIYYSFCEKFRTYEINKIYRLLHLRHFKSSLIGDRISLDAFINLFR